MFCNADVLQSLFIENKEDEMLSATKEYTVCISPLQEDAFLSGEVIQTKPDANWKLEVGDRIRWLIDTKTKGIAEVVGIHCGQTPYNRTISFRKTS